MQTEILLQAGVKAEVDVVVRFLHTQRRQVAKASDEKYEPVAALEADGRQFVTWDEAIVRETRIAAVSVRELLDGPQRGVISFPARQTIETIRSEAQAVVGQVVCSCGTLQGIVEFAAESVADGLYRLRVKIENLTPLAQALSRADAQRHAFLSTHAILFARDGEFVSLLEPPEPFAAAAAGCDNRGTWPVLAGEQGAKDTVLSSPIILYDYPKVAPESKVTSPASTTLRVLTLTDDEKREMAATDARTKNLLERCEAFTRDDLFGLHGAFRNPSGARRLEGGALAVGAHARLRPKGQGDIFDIVLRARSGLRACSSAISKIVCMSQ